MQPKKTTLKKFWSIIVAIIFINFTALPGIAAMLGYHIPQTNATVSEEEQSHSFSTVFEKTLPKPLDIFDYIKFEHAPVYQDITFILKNDALRIHPHISIFSPPPEIL